MSSFSISLNATDKTEEAPLRREALHFSQSSESYPDMVDGELYNRVLKHIGVDLSNDRDVLTLVYLETNIFSSFLFQRLKVFLWIVK